ncbi:MAG: GntR family transcriptional regulator [Actinomycetota bacterium]|jgi:GntR family transcriptional regulator|nr:GntR family transcriptional regulator [Actinomycetota bacterium]
MSGIVFYIDPSDEVPVYRQLMDQIRLHVTTGELSPNDELPSTRALSTELGVNPMTVSKAYSLLERDGMVTRRPGRPHVIASTSTAQVAQDRDTLLRASLEPAARLARQLDMNPAEALALFEHMLANGDDKSPRRHTQDTER